jgi:hypothetical protein
MQTETKKTQAKEDLARELSYFQNCVDAGKASAAILSLMAQSEAHIIDHEEQQSLFWLMKVLNPVAVLQSQGVEFAIRVS